jgi:hypothetical protein
MHRPIQKESASQPPATIREGRRKTYLLLLVRIIFSINTRKGLRVREPKLIVARISVDDGSAFICSSYLGGAFRVGLCKGEGEVEREEKRKESLHCSSWEDVDGCVGWVVRNGTVGALKEAKL